MYYLKKIKANSVEKVKIRGKLIEDIENVNKKVTIHAARLIYKGMNQK
jgi:hypothetical protein